MQGFLRLAGFFVLVLVAMSLLRHLPVVGALFRFGLLSFWLTAILLSLALARWSTLARDRRKLRALERQLGAVDTPHNQGKLGSLLLAQGRAAAALPALERAVEAEPNSAEWRYRQGSALLALRRPAEAAAALERAAAIDEEHAYGTVLLRLADACTRSGDPERAHGVLERFERNHGPNPESAYRRGRALRAAGRRDDARRAFAEVSALTAGLAGYQRRESLPWVTRAFFARLV